jgi:hypothetical protein
LSYITKLKKNREITAQATLVLPKSTKTQRFWFLGFGASCNSRFDTLFYLIRRFWFLGFGASCDGPFRMRKLALWFLDFRDFACFAAPVLVTVVAVL